MGSKNKDLSLTKIVTFDNLLDDVKNALQSGSEIDWRNILTQQQIDAITPAAISKKKTNRRDDGQSSNRIAILHQLAQNVPVGIYPFVEWLIQTPPYSFHLKTKMPLYSNYTPFLLALQQRNDEFVRAVLKNQSKEKLAAILNPSNPSLDEENCLHLAIEKESPFTLKIIEICQMLESTDIFKQGDNQETKNTPLHCAVISLPDNLQGQQKQREVVKCLIEACDSVLLIPDGAGDTPYQARIRVLQDEDDPCQDGEHSGSNIDPSASGTMLDLLGKDGVLPAQPNTSVEQSNEAALSTYENYDFEHPSTGSQASDEDYPKSFKEDKEFRQIIINDPILSLIRDYCVRNFSNADVASALYHATQEREIYFNLSGRSNLCLTRAYLDKLSRHLKLESILKYVTLPKLTLETPQGELHQKDNTSKGRHDMEEIFQWLRDNGVKQILTVIVIDNVEPSHSDKSIKLALEGFSVESWDWKKLDLNCEVIANSTKGSAKEVSLYCSGNNAVLMGWSSEAGLRSKKKFPKLEKVYLYYREGLEDEATLEANVKIFKDLLTTHTNEAGKTIDVTVTKDDEKSSYMDGFQAGGTMASTSMRNRWLDDMKPFLQIIFNIPPKEASSIKIAVIDNGVDTSLDILDGKIEAGASFCPIPNTSYHNSYYMTSETLSHGSIVAALICQMCPKAKLYIARLNETPSASNGTRLFTAESATKAIQWATRKKVDIICMSWTIELISGHNDKEIEELKKAVDDAHEKKIIMLCSASDQGSASPASCYPGSTMRCIRIGAATESGDRWSLVNEQDVDFIFPGENVPVKPNNDGPAKTYNGSSVATAIAAGSAGLLLYLEKLYSKMNHHSKNNNNLQEEGAMRKAFETMASISITKCPRFSDYFANRFSEMEFNTEPEMFYEKLRGILEEIKKPKRYYHRTP